MKTNYTIHRVLLVAILVISFLGFLDATYLAVKHYLGEPVTCSLFEGCGKVTTSQYSTIFGVSLAFLGAVYYLSLLVLIIAYIDRPRSNLAFAIKNLTILGLVTSIVLLYLQIFVIKALCIYCLGSAISSTTLFILTRFIRSETTILNTK